MQNSTILLKVKLRLNKLASNDYDNVEDWQIVEAFNKAQNDWCRRNLHGLNVMKEGDEQSTRRIDDFQTLLTTVPVTLTKQERYQEGALPGNYLQWKRIFAKATSECCPIPVYISIYLAEQANVDELLTDYHKRPSYEWRETFATLSNDKIQIYTDDKFEVVDANVVYYRQPRLVQIANVSSVYSDVVPTVDVECELKDDLIELLIDETVKILSGDIESMLQTQRNSQSVENNN
jgi:hypothetical protein